MQEAQELFSSASLLSSSASALDSVSEAVLASSIIVVYRQSIIYQCPQPLSHLITDKPNDIRQQRTRKIVHRGLPQAAASGPHGISRLRRPHALTLHINGNSLVASIDSHYLVLCSNENCDG